jgi:hypothetical protein
MHEGAWINTQTGAWSWVTEHASWIQKPENAQSIGLPVGAYSRLAAIPWDFNGPGREAILLTVMNAGFIRMRGHGAVVTFEFTIPLETAIQAVAPFMAQHFGPMTGCRFNDLHTGRSFGANYEELGHLIASTRVVDPAAGCSDPRLSDTPSVAPSDFSAQGTDA